ncbi:MAG: hypothetical protein KGI78_04490, partial [Patescibacteria group bacterium]|nr:hypothetical protein [Patescibacteria group bacterium]
MLPASTPRFDLLPPERERALRRSYVRRLFVVAALALAFEAVAACVLLAPTYRYLAGARERETARLAGLTKAVSTAEGSALAKRYDGLEADAAAIEALGATASASAVLRDALAVPRAGVALTSLAYDRGGGKRPGVLTVGGVAASRDDLRAYELALGGAPGFASADLPVSSFAKDANIPFTITVTLATSSPT